jgi:hypothetical protein
MTVRERFDRVWPSLVALLGTVAVVAGLLVLFGGDDVDPDPDDDPTAVSTDGAAPSATTPPPEAPAAPVTAPPELREDVAILNATDLTGLAAEAEQQLEAGGWTVPAIDTYSGDVAETTIFYPDGMQASAEALAAQFPVEIARAAPTIAGLTTERLVLIVAEDYAEAVGFTE